MQWLNDRLSKAKGWIIEQWDDFIRVQKDCVPSAEWRRHNF
jgi:hypothetical protein